LSTLLRESNLKKKAEDSVSEYPLHIETKVACLEQSIIFVNDTLNRIEKNILEVKEEIKDVRKEMKYDFRFLVTIICGLAAVMAHGFHWF